MSRDLRWPILHKEQQCKFPLWCLSLLLVISQRGKPVQPSNRSQWPIRRLVCLPLAPVWMEPRTSTLSPLWKAHLTARLSTSFRVYRLLGQRWALPRTLQTVPATPPVLSHGWLSSATYRQSTTMLQQWLQYHIQTGSHRWNQRRQPVLRRPSCTLPLWSCPPPAPPTGSRQAGPFREVCLLVLSFLYIGYLTLIN